ncbi:hypothetical protein [Bacillus glycinifermentans]|uniref:hypothetical protein n=1 Tax=Bacillus glycinifermentans TaxID=1664069 RepID=UPI003D1E126C
MTAIVTLLPEGETFALSCYIGNRLGCFIVDFNFGKCCRKICNNGFAVSLTVSFYSSGSKRFPPFESSDLGIQRMDRLQNSFIVKKHHTSW